MGSEHLNKFANNAAAEILLTALTSREVRYPRKTYLNDKVRRIGHGSLQGRRTEIDLPDGRMAVVHENMKPVIGLAALRYDEIEVKDPEGAVIDSITLHVDPHTSPTNPSYTAHLQGKEVELGAYNDIALDLADYLHGRALLHEIKGGETGGMMSLGNSGYLSVVVDAIKPGYTIDDLVEQGYLVEPTDR